MKLLVPLLLVSSSFASAQLQFHFGVAAGVPLSDTLSSSSSSSSSTTTSPPYTSASRYNSVTKRLLVGPVIRVDLPRGFGLEFDALYQRLNYDNFSSTAQPGYNNQSFEQGTGNRWQFPLLAQYHWSLSHGRMFVEAGPSISRIANGRSALTQSGTSGGSYSSGTATTTGLGGALAGVTVGAGIDISVLGRHLRPEFRYSHWLSAPGSGGIAYASAIFVSSTVLPPTAVSSFRTNQDEAAFLLGLTF